MSMSESFSVPSTLIKLLPHKSSEWSSLVSGPKAKSSSEIMNPISFTVSYHLGVSSGIFRTRTVGALKWIAIPFYGGSHFIITLYDDQSVLGGPSWHGS